MPIYIHPAYPHPAVVEAYYKDYLGEYPNLASSGWGFGVETATQGIRFVLSGVFDKFPKLQIVLGHLGEGLPFYLWRISQSLARPGNAGAMKSFRDVFVEHFYITTSGFFSDPALQCCITELGIDRVMFSIDYPFVENPPGTDWINALSLNASDKGQDPQRGNSSPALAERCNAGCAGQLSMRLKQRSPDCPRRHPRGCILQEQAGAACPEIALWRPGMTRPVNSRL